MFETVKKFFDLSQKELRALLYLILLLISFFILPKVYFTYKKPKSIQDNSAFEQWIVSLETQDSIDLSRAKKQNLQNIKIDFNTISFQELIQLGIDKNTSNNLVKFRNKGARFYSKEDVLKVYGFSPELYHVLEKNIVFPKRKSFSQNSKPTKPIEKPEHSKIKIDPNTASWKELTSIGLEPKTANILINFREKGARFYNKEDLLKVYGFTEQTYIGLKEFIQFPPIDLSKERSSQSNNENSLLVIDINKAGLEDFKKLKGIGNFYGQKIINYRTKLGGYYATEQLKEVYGLSEELYAEIEKNLIVESPVLKKIDLNNTNFTELIKHPYIDKETCLQILNLKQQINGFLNIEDLKSYAVLNNNSYQKLKPYLEVKTKK